MTEKLLAFTFNRSIFDFLRNVELADPQFHVSSDIDILVGADLFWQILCIGQIKSSAEQPMLQKTRFGWIVAGRLAQSANVAKAVQSFHSSIIDDQLHEQIKRFWQIESIENAGNFTINEVLCEQHFRSNVTRNLEGRYIVKLPIKAQVIDRLGCSKEIAMKRLFGLERKFMRDPSLKSQYVQFLNEYVELGHMQKISESSDDLESAFYLPHHGIFKGPSDSSKLRVVFDASSKTSSGISLNDALMTSPVVQQDLMSILLRFRMFLYC